MSRLVLNVLDWVAIPSVTGSEADYGDALARECARIGLDVERQTVQPGRDYQLQVSLYKASSAAAPGDYSAELRANGNTLATIPLTESVPMFVTVTGSQLGKCLK